MHTEREAPQSLSTIRGTVRWQSPSNIAIVKYWGKHGNQLPSNPSLSFTLSSAHTTTTITYSKEGDAQLTFYFEGKDHPAFARRIEQYLESVFRIYPVLRDYRFHIRSENSFPHSTGIASSASAMSALALCFGTIASTLSKALTPASKQTISELARLGSGSASRSIYGPVAVWGAHPKIPGSSDNYAVPVENMHATFDGLCDSILIVDRGEKAVSSSAGHALMHGHPFAEQRFAQARHNLDRLIPALRNGDIETFIEVAETEALSLHAMMMTSTPSYMLMKPGTLEIIEAIRALRASSGTPVCFTLDAGPNVHVLYPGQVAPEVRSWIDSTLKQYCAEGQVIHDQAGAGPIRLKS